MTRIEYITYKPETPTIHVEAGWYDLDSPTSRRRFAHVAADALNSGHVVTTKKAEV